MDDSSPDLSLKLRRRSSDSRDSFYMDFDKGIDSDIEEMATTSAADLGDTTADTTATPTALGHGKTEGERYVIYYCNFEKNCRNTKNLQAVLSLRWFKVFFGGKMF